MRLETQGLSKQNGVLAGIQMVSGPRVADNLKTAGQLIAQVADLGAQLVALPEYFPIIGAADADRVRAREAYGSGPVQDWLAEHAQRHGIWLFAGSIPLAADAPDKMRNSSLAYNPQGACAARYDKIHLFGFARATRRMTKPPSSSLKHAAAVDTPFGRVAAVDLLRPALSGALP